MNCDVDLVSGTTSVILIEDPQVIEYLLNNQHLVEIVTIPSCIVLSCVWAPGVLSALLGDARRLTRRCWPRVLALYPGRVDSDD